MSFKGLIEADMQTFINTDEFAETHNINGRALKVLIDNDRLMQRSKQEYEGIIVGELLYYVSAVDYGPAPKADAVQSFDNKTYQVFDVRSDGGMYEIILHRNGV